MYEERDFKELHSLFQAGRRLNFQKGELIIRANEEPRGIYKIESGIVKVYALSRHNDQHIHHFFGPGDFIALLWAFQDYSRNLYYECLEKVTVSVVSKDEFLEFVKKNDPVMLEILQEMVLRYIRYAGRIENLLYSNASERCAYRLLSLVNRFGIDNKEGLEIRASITHEDMARETFSRSISRLLQKKAIDYDEHRHIVIKDIAYLIKIIGSDEVEATWPNLMKYNR